VEKEIKKLDFPRNGEPRFLKWKEHHKYPEFTKEFVHFTEDALNKIENELIFVDQITLATMRHMRNDLIIERFSFKDLQEKMEQHIFKLNQLVRGEIQSSDYDKKAESERITELIAKVDEQLGISIKSNYASFHNYLDEKLDKLVNVD
jgi:hypothetical protein